MALFPTVGRQQPAVRTGWWTVTVVLCIGVVLHLIPFYFMIITSLKTGAETFASPPTFWPHEFTTSAWRLVFQVSTANSSDTAVAKLLDQPFVVYFWNSLFIVLVTLAISLPVTSLAAYALSKVMRGPLARWWFLFFIGTLMMPTAITLLPSLLLTLNFPFAVPEGSVPLLPGTDMPFPTFRIWDTPFAIIIPAAFNAFNFLLFKGFFDTIPSSVIQAARVDGGSELNIFRRIVFPMSIPVYAVAAWLQFSGVWDNFLWPSLVISSPEKQTTAVAIYTIVNKLLMAGAMNPDQATAGTQAMQEAIHAGLTWNGAMVLGILQTLPIFLMFIVCREYLLKGVHIRGFK